MDVCNGVMEKMDYFKGFISFILEYELVGGIIYIVCFKLVGYLVVLLVMCGLLVVDIVIWVFLEVDIICDCNFLYCENMNGDIENVYIFKVFNKL